MKGMPTTINISTRTIMRVVIALAIITALVVIKDLVLVFLTSIVIATFIRAASRRLSKYRIPKQVSVVALYALVFAVAAVVFYFFIPILIIEVSNLLPLIAQFIPSGVGGEVTSIANSLNSNQSLTEIATSLSGLLESVSAGFFTSLSSIFGGIVNLVLIVIISFYLSLEKGGIESFLRIITPIKYEKYVIGLWQRSQRKIAYWFKGQLLLGLIVGLLTFIGLSLLGVPYALLLSVVAGLFEIIPFGIILAAIVAIGFSFATGGISLALMTTALYVVIQQLEAYLFSPLVVNKVTGISPILVILSVLVGVQLAGVWGLILAIPVAVTILEYANDVEKNKLEEIHKRNAK